ncbi:MAG TPA: polysaccharide deacetylase family protein [Polyangiaceae bacterium]|jgi:peptidoglycan/xylan/chitin deacetylase (PgdA/CDA1 family)
MAGLCSISVDLDGMDQYAALYGVERPSEAGSLSVAIERFEELCNPTSLRGTLFVIASDLKDPALCDALRGAASRGHELANHTRDHFYDLTLRGRTEMTEQVASASAMIEQATGQRPEGFRAPGYTVSDELFEVLAECGVSYDSSVFPCPSYYTLKAAKMLAIRVAGRRSRAVLDRPSVLRAPTRPYRVGRPYWVPGGGLRELPIQVAGPLRMPFIGTTLSVLGPRAARVMTYTVLGESFVNLELHAIDFLDEHDGLTELARHQVDLRIPVRRKMDTLSAVIETLRKAGFAFAPLAEAARAFF